MPCFENNNIRPGTVAFTCIPSYLGVETGRTAFLKPAQGVKVSKAPISTNKLVCGMCL
jgi:hypothetical protein